MSTNVTHRGLVPLLLMASSLTVMAGAVIGPVVAEIGKALSLSPTQSGRLITTHGLTIAVVSLAAGRLIDRVGPRVPLSIGLLVYGAAGVAGMFIRDYEWLLVARAILGLGVAGMFTGVTVAILRAYSGAEQSRVMGLRGAANSIGGVIWPLIGGGLGAIAWYAPFGIYAVGLPLGIAAFFIIPKLPAVVQEADGASVHDAGTGTGAEADAGSEARREQGDSKTRITAWLILPYVAMFATNMLLYSIVVFFPQRLARMGIESTVLISLFLAAAAMCATLVATQYGKVARHLSIPGRALVALVLWVPAFALAAAPGGWILMLVGAMLFGTGQGLMLPTVMLWVDSLADKRRQATASSLLPVFGFLGQFASPPAFGPIVEARGFGVMFIVAVALPLVLLLPTVAAARKSPR